MVGRFISVAFALALSAAFVSPSLAANPLEKNFWLPGPDYDRQMPACDTPAALNRIIGNFRTKEIRFWNSNLQIVGIEHIRETTVMPWAAQSIPQRFCSGVALINDSVRHPIYYSISGSIFASSASTATGLTVPLAARPSPEGFSL
jgi:hypothetical protein